VVQRRQRAAESVALKHREVNNPHRCPVTGIEIQIFTHFAAQCTQGFRNHIGFVGTKEHNIAVLGIQSAA